MCFKIQVVIKLIIIRFHKWIYKDDLIALQQKKWKRFQLVLLESPFYRQNAQKNLPLQDYPIINKALFMENFDRINTQNIKLKDAFQIAVTAENSRDFSPTINNITVGLSSGTSGNRGIFLATEKERAQWVAAVLDRVIGISFKKRNVAFFLRANSNLYESVKSKILQFEFFDLLDSIETHIERLNNLQADIIVAPPSMLLELAVHFSIGKLVVNPIKIISVAEVLYPEDKKFLEITFKQKIHQVYQCTEGFLASTCKEGILHFNEDFLIIEKKYLDDSKSRFHPIITDLMRYSQPIVRFELNDIILEKSKCSCGQNSMAIEQIEGRSDDVLCFETEKGNKVNIYPDFFRRAIILSDDSIQDYQVVKRKENQIELFVNGTQHNYENAEKGIQLLLNKYNVKQVRIIRILEKPNQHINKLRRIRNE
mgnify:CR=1 FL=1